MSHVDTISLLNRQHARNLVNILTDPDTKELAETWFQTDTVDAWRHDRMYECLDLRT